MLCPDSYASSREICHRKNFGEKGAKEIVKANSFLQPMINSTIYEAMTCNLVSTHIIVMLLFQILACSCVFLII